MTLDCKQSSRRAQQSKDLARRTIFVGAHCVRPLQSKTNLSMKHLIHRTRMLTLHPARHPRTERSAVKDLARRTIFVGARCARPRLQESNFTFEKGTPSPPAAELPPRKEPLKDDLLRVAALIGLWLLHCYKTPPTLVGGDVLDAPLHN